MNTMELRRLALNNVTVKVFNGSGRLLPKYETLGAAGMDVASVEDVEIPAGKVVPVKTGIFCQIPAGYAILVMPRSGLSLKTPLRIANSIGLIDSDYTGEIVVLLWNTGNVSYNIKSGDRVAQFVLSEVPKIIWEVVDDRRYLESTGRGENGLGSTGIN